MRLSIGVIELNFTRKGFARSFILFSILFIYVFAFYLGPLSTSLILGGAFWGYAIINRRFFKECLKVISTNLIIRLLKCWTIIIIIGLIFPIIFTTFDYTFVYVFIAQLFHYIAAIPVFAFLSCRKYSIDEVEKSFILIFVIQTFIQLIVASNPDLRSLIFAFNHFDPNSVVGMGDNFRGSALSAATTYHLSLAYGICFIIYVKHYILKKIDITTVICGILIFAGIFCAGRSGFIGCIIAIIGYLLINKRYVVTPKLITAFKIVIFSLIIITVIYSLLAVFAPNFFEMLNTYILPYAFEFIYNYQEGGNVETASTNDLMNMWNRDLNYMELFFGSGHFTNPDGLYYMHVDPGVLRHLLYFGIAGYILILYYQYLAIPFLRIKGVARYFCGLIYLFIFIMDFKGLTAGGNKFMIFIPLLLSYTYLYLPTTKHNNHCP